jgi:hypothetical protein
MRYPGNNKLAARTFFSVFIDRWGLHDVHTSDSKAMWQLGMFPREIQDLTDFDENNTTNTEASNMPDLYSTIFDSYLLMIISSFFAY